MSVIDALALMLPFKASAKAELLLSVNATLIAPSEPTWVSACESVSANVSAVNAPSVPIVFSVLSSDTPKEEPVSVGVLSTLVAVSLTLLVASVIAAVSVSDPAVPPLPMSRLPWANNCNGSAVRLAVPSTEMPVAVVVPSVLPSHSVPALILARSACCSDRLLAAVLPMVTTMPLVGASSTIPAVVMLPPDRLMPSACTAITPLADSVPVSVSVPPPERSCSEMLVPLTVPVTASEPGRLTESARLKLPGLAKLPSRLMAFAVPVRLTALPAPVSVPVRLPVVITPATVSLMSPVPLETRFTPVGPVSEPVMAMPPAVLVSVVCAVSTGPLTVSPVPLSSVSVPLAADRLPSAWIAFDVALVGSSEIVPVPASEPVSSGVMIEEAPVSVIDPPPAARLTETVPSSVP